MSQTILIEPNDDFRKLFALNLSTYVGTDVIDRENAKDAISLLKILPNIDLIVTTPEISGEASAIELWNYVEKQNLDIPIIVLGACEELEGKALCLNAPVDWESLVKNSLSLLGIPEKEMNRNVLSSYVPVDIKYFYEIDYTPCDIFIRIKKSETRFEYVKRLHMNDSFETQTIKKYEQQGLQKFYIHADYQQYFMNFIATHLINKLEQDILLEQRLHANSTSYEVVKDYIQSIGIDDSITELAQSSIQSMVSTVRQIPNLGNLLKMLLSSKISYAYQRAHLVCITGHFIMSKQKWYKTKHLDVFSMASFFSDITLKTMKQIRISSRREFEAAQLSQDEKNSVKTHAIDAANLLVDTVFYSEYLFLIIKQHHGSHDGIGFPNEISEDIHPIAKCFIIADACVKIMLDPQGPKNKKELLSILYADYPSESFQKIIKVLENKIK